MYIDVMTADLRDWLVKFYCQLSQFDEPVTKGPSQSPLSVTTPTTRNGIRTECCHLCAYNFPVRAGITSYVSISTSIRTTCCDKG